MSELTDREADVLEYNIRETLFRPTCDACGWTIWPDRPHGTASGQVEDCERGGHVDNLRICERCVDIGPGVWVNHQRWADTRTAFDNIVIHEAER